MKQLIRDLRWIFPSSLGFGLVLSILDGHGYWWSGWLVFSFILLAGLIILSVAWRWASAGQAKNNFRTLGLILLVALILRIGAGVAFSYILPAYGNGGNVEKAGYIFRDAFARDGQAWNLAASSAPIWKAFDKSYITDQYGGLLALSAFLYRYSSPDAHRPWLIIVLGALTSVIGIAIAWKAVSRKWGEPIAKPTAWILALYPEAILMAGSQMREPFLMTFIVMSFWGVLDWQSSRSGKAWGWVIAGLIGMLLFNPGVAIFALTVLGGWLWFQRQEKRIPWRTVLIGAGIIVLALVLLWLGLARGPLAGKSPVEVFSSWLKLSAQWDTYLLGAGSGVVKAIFGTLPKSLHIPFATGYGLTQPLLPAAIAEPTVWPWRVIGVLRALGWYLLLPFLAASLISILKTVDKNERRAWLWLWFVSWFWIVLSSLRAGGDQWDNPRYRVIFLLWQALLAVNAWVWWRKTHNPWMARILVVEGVFLVFFTYWYATRYWISGLPVMPVFIILAAILVTSSAILLGGWIVDWRIKRHQRR
jgi:hypothetical protein